MRYEEFENNFSSAEISALGEAGIKLSEFFPEGELNGVTPLEHVIQKAAEKLDLTAAQRSALALWLLPESKIPEQAGKPGTGPLGSRYPVKSDASLRAAQIAQIGKSAMETAIRIQKLRPEIVDEMRRGELNLSQASRACGLARGIHSIKGHGHSAYTGRKTKTGAEIPIYYGKGDRWKEASSPLLRYIAAWGKRGYEYRHLNPREARQRLTQIDHIINELGAMKADLEPRAHSATMSISQKGR